jgi:hypothetical protein
VAQAVQCLLCKCEALSSNPTKKERKRKPFFYCSSGKYMPWERPEDENGSLSLSLFLWFLSKISVFLSHSNAHTPAPTKSAEFTSFRTAL